MEIKLENKMETLQRHLFKTILKELKPNKVAMILGARRAGKTVLINQLRSHLEGQGEFVLYLNGEDFNTWDMMTNRTVEHYKNLLGKHTILMIDEAQKIPGIGAALKLMVDALKGIKIIVTGSSMFDLENKLGEPLVGRKFTYLLFPFAQLELSQVETAFKTHEKLNERLVLGAYPELFQIDTWEGKQKHLGEIVNGYLLKDILELENIKNSSKVFDLLRMIAYQVGSEVSYEELANALGLSKPTVEKYLDLLSKVFVLFKVGSYSGNLRKEISKKHKWYFHDNGIRNALISNFNLPNTRQDIGQLWENYCISERIKFQHYTDIFCNNFFWRTYDRQEIDWLEEREGNLFAYEMKWGIRKTRPPKGFTKNYPEGIFQVIDKEKYLTWIT